MRIDILSLFPEIPSVMLGESMMKRAQEAGLVSIRSHNIRDWATDKHRTVDDAPYGGGPGMVMKCEPIFSAIEALTAADAAIDKREGADPAGTTPRVVYMSPSGRRFNQRMAEEYARLDHLIVLCGHYEGVDQRVLDHAVHDEVSIGDYVLTNGAIAAVVFIDAIVRLLPGVLGHEESAPDDSFSCGHLEGPQYTRPVEFRGWRAPDILLSGNHGAVAKWRKEQALAKTRRIRPDLLDAGNG